MTYTQSVSLAALTLALTSCGQAETVTQEAAAVVAPKPASIVVPVGTDTAPYLTAREMMAELVVNPKDAATFTARCERAFEMVNSMYDELGARTDPATLRDLKDYDTIENLGGTIGYGEAYILAETNPDSDIRDAGDACVNKASETFAKISLSRPVYERLAAIDAAKLSTRDAYLLNRTLKGYKRGGVDKDQATRDKVEALNVELAGISTAFGKNLREAQGQIKVEPGALEGLPQDYIDSHKPGDDGKITITTDYPDTGPIFKYAADIEMKRKLSTQIGNRAYPENEKVLRSLLEKRYELARTLGYPTYADLIMEDKMTGKPAVAEKFLAGVEGAARKAAGIEYDRLLTRYKQEEPDAVKVPSVHASYLSEKILKSDYALDSQEVRQYFAYDNVRGGIFELVQDLFDVEIRDWNNAPVWHEDVTAHEMYQNGELLGRFFLDMHPRDNKFKHAAAFPIRFGPTSQSVPVASLVCNFPKGDHTTGLMEHGQVETFLHEFGHLIHGMFSGAPDYQAYTMSNVEWDFVEAPSQILENWVWDYETLSKFAVNDKGDVLPKPLFDKMLAGRDFGKGLGTLGQLRYAAISLNYYNRPPSEVDFVKIWDAQYARFSPFEANPGEHRYASFGHLDGYSAIYYTYQWSNAIAADLFSEFEANGLRDKATAKRYRDLVLAPGSSKPAAELIHDFLGRDWSPEAYEQSLIDAAKSGAKSGAK